MTLRPWFACLLFAGALSAQEPPAAGAPGPGHPDEPVLQIPEPGRFKALFQPFRTELATLSPDGKHVAYSIRDGDTVSVMITNLDQPDGPQVRVQVVDDNAATAMLGAEQREKTPGRILSIRWVTKDRLLVETNRIFIRAGEGWESAQGAVIGFNADGTNSKVLLTPKDLVELMPNPAGAGQFSVGRGNSRGFDARVFRPDRPVPSVEAGTTGAYTPPQNPMSTDGPAREATAGGVTLALPRSFRVFDLDPARPAAVTVVARGSGSATGYSSSLRFFSLNALTGKLSDLTYHQVPVSRAALVDRQGHPRLLLSQTLLSSFPLRYEYLGPRGGNRRRPLGEVTGLAGFSVSPENYFGERAIPLGFDEDPNVLYYASNVGRDTFGIYSLDLATQRRGRLTIENPGYDLISAPTAGFPEKNPLVFDRFSHRLAGVRYTGALRTTAWLRPEWRDLQALLEKTLPGHSVEIIDWDKGGRRFLVRSESPADPGAFFVFEQEKDKLLEFARRSPEVDAKQVHQTLPFACPGNNGSQLTGLVTVPRQPRLKPIPLVVFCPDEPWERVSPDFRAEVQALAEMGFVVVQLNGRGAWGSGRRQRESLTAGYDLVQVEDIVATVTALEKSFNVNPKRVALLGRGHGGFIALRALQTHPERFRCAVALEAPINLGKWLTDQKWDDTDDVQPQLVRAWLGDAGRLEAAPLDRQPEAIAKPVLLLAYPGAPGAARRAVYLDGRNFANRIMRQGGTAEFEDLTIDFINGLPAARAAVFDRIEEFLNLHIYDFKVKVHDTKILKPTDNKRPRAP